MKYRIKQTRKGFMAQVRKRFKWKRILKSSEEFTLWSEHTETLCSLETTEEQCQKLIDEYDYWITPKPDAIYIDYSPKLRIRQTLKKIK